MTLPHLRSFLAGALPAGAAALPATSPHAAAQTTGYANASHALRQPGGATGTIAFNHFSPAALAVGFGLLGLGLRRGRTRRVSALAVLAAGLLGLASPASAQMFGLANIQNWTGTGSNQAAMVLDWNDGKGPESLVWGFRWNGTATGLDMFRAIDQADPRLALFTGTDPTFGTFVYGIGYDLNGNGGTFTPGTPRSNETGSASDPGDHYAEGFFSRYWAYYNSDTGSPYGGGGAWAFGNSGAAGRTLVNGSWDGYSISDANFNAPDPGFPSPAAAVPEPGPGLLLVGAGGLVFLLGRRGGNRRARA